MLTPLLLKLIDVSLAFTFVLRLFEAQLSLPAQQFFFLELVLPLAIAAFETVLESTKLVLELLLSVARVA